MEKILTKAEAIELYGTEKQKDYFKKYKKIQKTIEDALIKTLEQHYSVVEKVKVGRSIAYKVSEERATVIEREDNRITNGERTIEYTKNMDIIVVSSLEQKLVTKEAQTLRKWLLDFGLISYKLFNLTGIRYNPKAEKSEIQDLLNKKILKDSNEKRILKDYIKYNKELQGQLEVTLKRMDKAKIIEFFKVHKAKLINESEPIELKTVTYNTIMERKRELRKIFGVTPWEVETLTFKKEVIEFKTAFKKYLNEEVFDKKGNHLSIDYVFNAYGITLLASEQRIMTFLLKYNKEAIELYAKQQENYVEKNKLDYVENRKEHMNKLATQTIQKNEVVKTQAQEMFGGRNFNNELKKEWNELYLIRINELQEHYGKVFKLD